MLVEKNKISLEQKIPAKCILGTATIVIALAAAVGVGYISLQRNKENKYLLCAFLLKQC